MSPEARWNRLSFIYMYAARSKRLRAMLLQVGGEDDEAERYLAREVAAMHGKHLFTGMRPGTAGSYEHCNNGVLLYCPCCGAPRHLGRAVSKETFYVCPDFCGYSGFVIVPMVWEALLAGDSAPDNPYVV